MVAQKRLLGNSIVKFLRSRSLTPMKHEVSVIKVLSREWIMSSFLQALREQPGSRVVEYAIVATGVAIAIAMVSIFQQFQ
jgi:Flp pilus assembly pilin Flp